MDKYSDQIFKYLLNIPKGKVVTYGQVARELGIPSPRIVGRVIHNNPEPFVIPCHRVVFADGSLAPSYAFGGEGKQRELLENEGVSFNKEKVDLNKSSWKN